MGGFDLVYNANKIWRILADLDKSDFSKQLKISISVPRLTKILILLARHEKNCKCIQKPRDKKS